MVKRIDNGYSTMSLRLDRLSSTIAAEQLRSTKAPKDVTLLTIYHCFVNILKFYENISNVVQCKSL